MECSCDFMWCDNNFQGFPCFNGIFNVIKLRTDQEYIRILYTEDTDWGLYELDRT